jgi:hypothetical protein
MAVHHPVMAPFAVGVATIATGFAVFPAVVMAHVAHVAMLHVPTPHVPTPHIAALYVAALYITAGVVARINAFHLASRSLIAIGLRRCRTGRRDPGQRDHAKRGQFEERRG